MQNEVVAPKVFDLRTHIKDPKTGDTIKVNHYKMEVSKTDGVRYERPIGSGNYYDGAGKLLIKGKDPVVEKTVEEVKQDLDAKNLLLAKENEELKAKLSAMSEQKTAPALQVKAQDVAKPENEKVQAK